MLSGALLRRPDVRFYTLHSKLDHTPYIVHIRNKEDHYQSTVVSLFRNKDALSIGNILESHKKMYGIFPENSFDYKTLYHLEIDSMIPIDYEKPLDELYIKDWKKDDIVNYCVEHLLDLMMIDDIEKDRSIQVIGFTFSNDYLIDRLKKSL
uniref:Uncharacterized protein n=1 Tax=viral metagenome TaxID=1070528 RepID=A0A6C0CTJ5_9ZZZZ